MMGSEGHWYYGGGVMWLLWIVLIIGAVIVFLNLVGRGNSTPTGKNESALDILKKRYARGEIDMEEYEQRRDELES